jgi:hypothetical protein
LIKESNNDAGLAAHPSRLFVTNQIHFQLAMLAYNFNAWLMLFNREATDKPYRVKSRLDFSLTLLLFSVNLFEQLQ